MVLYASYVCLLHSHIVKSHLIDFEVTNPLFLRWFCHTHNSGRWHDEATEAPLKSRMIGGQGQRLQRTHTTKVEPRWSVRRKEEGACGTLLRHERAPPRSL
jgi:hypothetical protein